MHDYFLKVSRKARRQAFSAVPAVAAACFLAFPAHPSRMAVPLGLQGIAKPAAILAPGRMNSPQQQASFP